MSPAELIRKKRFGETHTHDEIHFLIDGYSHDRIPDYQMSAWLMAICLKGMTAQETAWLTEEMRDSGASLDLSDLGITIDKHSTGGVGDKVSIILAPLVAAAGVPVPMMAGRGLGHTGGTLDKLESIRGFNASLTFEQFRRQVAEVGTAIIGQTAEFCPADRKLYALRDVTGTVDSLPLICGSIMSKKLAEGMSGLVLDVKFGSGAFMKTLGEAEALAHALMDIGTRCGKKIHALLTRMDEPLGRFVGNSVEIRECLDILNNKEAPPGGKSYTDTVELTLTLAGQMIFMGGKAPTPVVGYEIAKKLLREGSAKNKFTELCKWQGGDLQVPLPEASHQLTIQCERAGYLRYLNVEKIGLAAVELGAGRKFASDKIEFTAGIEILHVQGGSLQKGDPLFKLFANSKTSLEQARKLILEGVDVSDVPVPQSPLIAKVLQ